MRPVHKLPFTRRAYRFEKFSYASPIYIDEPYSLTPIFIQFFTGDHPVSLLMKRSFDTAHQPPTKRTKTTDDVADRLDPVEKLLSLSCSQEVFNLEQPIVAAEDTESGPDLNPLNFSQLFTENIRKYYQQVRKARLEDPSFTRLNSKEEVITPKRKHHQPAAPFFKNVNFGQSLSLPSSLMEDYFSYDEADSDEDTPTSPTDPVLALPLIDMKKCLYYRHHAQLNLAADDEEWYPSPRETDYDKCFKRATPHEEVAFGNNYLINDFFL